MTKIYKNISEYKEKKSIFLDTILNKKEEKKYEKRFELFELIKDNIESKFKNMRDIKDKYIEIERYIIKAKNILFLLSKYFEETLKKEISQISGVCDNYSDKEKEVNSWVDKEYDIVDFVRKYEEKSDLIKKIKEIKLFQIIYSKFTEGNETIRFDKAKKLLDECKIIFTDINKCDPKILGEWQNNFKRVKDQKIIDEELQKLKDYYKIDDKENNLNKIAKNILIFTKKNIYYDDIKCLIYFINLFETEGPRELTKILQEKKLEFEDKEHFDFEKLEKINDFLEKKNIYVNDGKDDSGLIQFVRLLNKKENQINFAKTKDIDSAAALIYKLTPTSNSLKVKDILEYQACVDYINAINIKVTEDQLLKNVIEKLKKDDINKVLKQFTNYFIHFESIKTLDSDFDNAKDIYQNISDVLNNSKFKITLFKREFKVYENDNEKEKEIIAKDLDGLIQLKDNINLYFEELPDIKTKDEKKQKERKKQLEEKKKKINIFYNYIEQLQTIIKYFTKLENKGCPFLIDITVTALKDEIKFELVNNPLKYKELILKLKEYCNTIVEFQSKYYKNNEYFRFVYDKQLYRLMKKTIRQEKDISSYIRFFTNGNSTKDDVPEYESSIGNKSLAYKSHRIAIKESFELISRYIENIFKINGTSLEKLYKSIEVKQEYNLKGIYKCNIQKFNVDQFIVKMFLKLTGSFPIAQNLLLTNRDTITGEIYSFMYRAIKCRFNALFIISISDEFSIQNVNIMTNLLNQIIRDMKNEGKIKKIEDLVPCLLFITHNQNLLGSSRGILDFPEVKDLPDYIKGDENQLEINLKNDDSSKKINSNEKKNLKKSDNSKSINKIFNAVKIYTSDCSGLGKSLLIKKEIKDNHEDYHYLGIGDDITKDELFKKLKRFLKVEIRGKANVAVHLDLFYTKNIPLMQYFLFAFLVTKLYQANDNILYIPQTINIYVEIPNGPQKFIDDFPILKIFRTINISLSDRNNLSVKELNENNLNIFNDLKNIQIQLDISEDKAKKLTWSESQINNEDIKKIIEDSKEMTYIEKQIYMNIISNLSSSENKDKIKYYEKVKIAAKYFTECVYSQKLRKPDMSQKNKTQKEIKEYIFNFLDFEEDKVLKKQYDAPLIFKTKDKYIEINISDEEVKEKKLEYFISNLKKIMSLDESIEEIKKMIGEYKITEDNYKKMILILFRIFTNIPVILMGETGCGKTELIRQLIKMLNKGKEEFLIIKTMHSGIKESEIIEIIKEAEKKLEKSKSNMICVFFDEINTTSLLSKMKEIFVNHSLNGKAINENIRFVGACNPFRKKEENENDNGLRLEKISDNGEEMTYLVNPLPNSLLYYIFYFKSLDDHDVKKYIESIIGEEFPKGENDESENSILRKEAIEVIYQSHNFVRKKNGKSSVSLRDLQRFKRAYAFFNKYYEFKKKFIKSQEKKISDKVEIMSKVQSFIMALFITYYIKIFKSGNDAEYCRRVNGHIENLAKSFKIDEWRNDKKWEEAPFKYLIIKEEDFILQEMEVETIKGIGLNNSLKENIFLMFFSIYSHIPLIVVGKPGCSKSLSIQLIIRIMRGEFSNSNFLKNYPTINSTGFQGSETNTPESIENIFNEAKKKIDNNKSISIESIFKEIKDETDDDSSINALELIENIFKKVQNEKFNKEYIPADSLEQIFEEVKKRIGNNESLQSIEKIFKQIKEIANKESMISLLVFDELGLSEKSPTNCLKVLHSELEMSLDPNKEKLLSFIGISNWTLDAAKMNRAMFLSIPDIKVDDIKITVKAIANSYDKEMYDIYLKQYELLGDFFFGYKNTLKKLNKETLEKYKNEVKESNNKILDKYKNEFKKINNEIFEDYENELDELKNSNYEIFEKYKDKFKGNNEIFNKYDDELKKSNNEILNKYKDELNKFEFYENFHGGRDLYHLVKNFSSEMIKYKKTFDPDVVDLSVKKSLLRNLSGLEINGDNTLKKYFENVENDKKLNFDDIKTIDLIKENILSKDSRFLLLSSEKSMFDFLINFIKKELEKMNENSSDNKQINYVNYIGSPFKGDKMNISYQTEMIVNIENSVAQGKVIILSNLDQIYSTFYDLFNQNYIVKDGKNYCRISHGPNIQKLALVNENSKFIILVDRNDLIKQKLPFLSRFEKHIISFDSLLEKEDKEKSKKINELLKNMISVNDINYNMNNILVNTNEDIINGYIYLYKDKENNSYENIIEDKIIPIIPQDFIFTLPLSELNKERGMDSFIKNKYSNNKPKSLEEYLKNDNRKENTLIVYTFSKIGEAINLTDKENYMERIASEINTVFKFKQILKQFYEVKEYKSLILKFKSDNAENINFFITEIKNYKEINKISDDNKKFIFIINIQREFNLDKKNEKKKVTTILITNEDINQLFIDNINGTELSIKDIEGKNISDYINKKYLDPKNLIIEGMLKFYGENINEQIGNCKGIDKNNVIKELKDYIEISNDLIDEIKEIILSKITKSEEIVKSIIENKSINQNTIDFVSAILIYVKDAFNNKLKELLRKTENNNFFTTLFMLNIKDIKKEDSISTISINQLNDYSFNISDEKILTNELIKKLKKEFLNMIHEDKTDLSDDTSINIKLYYKIPGFFKIYKEIQKYIQNEKLAFYYRKDEAELRKCDFEFISQSKFKLKEDKKEFTNKLYVEFISKPLVTKIANAKITDENYIEFNEIFLNDYITFYLVNIYKNEINDFVINDIPHKIILLLLDLKFKGLQEDEKISIPLQNSIAKILWLEGNVNHVKKIFDIYNIISNYILYDKKDKEILFKEILNFKNEIKYNPKKKHLIEINEPYYIIFILLFKCMINKESIKIATSKNDNYFSYFKNLERCLKEMKKLDRSLELDIKELSVLSEFIDIYKVFEHANKINKLDINELINSFKNSLEIIKDNEETKENEENKENEINEENEETMEKEEIKRKENPRIKSLCENLKMLNKNIKESLYDLSKEKEIKGDTVYYELISNILLNEIKRENNKEYKVYILKEFLLEDEKLFIQSIQLLKIILEDYISSNIDLFQTSLINLSSPDLKILEDKLKNDWIKETILYIFEQISILYIKNLIFDNEKRKKENKIEENILIYLKSFFENCLLLLESLYKDPELKNENQAEVKSNLNLKKIFALSFTRVYLKIFIDWIDKQNISDDDITKIIKTINGEEINPFRDMLSYFIYKIIYNTNQKELTKLFDKDIIEKYHLDEYKSYNIFKTMERDYKEASKYIIFIEAYKTTDEDYNIFKEEFIKLKNYLESSGNEESELKELIQNKKRDDIFYSAFSAKISAHLSNPIENNDKINLLSEFIHNIYEDKEKLINIYDLFLDKSSYTKKKISPKTAEILQYCLKYCINADDICDERNKIYYPLYNDQKDFDFYLPGNDIPNRKIYDFYSKIKDYLDNNPSNHGVYICTCNINKENKEIYAEFIISNNGYPKKSGNCKYCGKPIGNDGKQNDFIKKDYYYRIFKNKEDLEKETKNKKNGNCITLQKFYEDFIFEKLEKDSIGVNISEKEHFDKEDKPIRNQSQIGYRLMNLILYSHLFTNVLFTDKDEIFTEGNFTYLDYITKNWEKLDKLLQKKGINNIYIFMNIIYKDLFNYLNEQKRIDSYEKLLEVEKNIENIIENKIVKKIKIKEKEFTKYDLFTAFYNKNKDSFRDTNPKYKITSIIREINNPDKYEEKDYPYYKSFLYSDYLDEAFLKSKFEEINKYPVIDLYLNRENNKKRLGKDFISFNFIIKSLHNNYSFHISRNAAKKLAFEETSVYKEHEKFCINFMNIINSKNDKNKLKKNSSLEYLFSTEIIKLYKELYNSYAKIQNNLLTEIIEKINTAGYEKFECQEINIQEAQSKDLLTLEFENKCDFIEILLTNINREFYNAKSKIKYNNYNLFSIDFDKIEKLLEDILIRNACILKTDEFLEMKYKGEDFLDDGISEFNKNIGNESLNKADKKLFIIFYKNNLENNLVSCLEINKDLKNIIAYVNKNKIKNNKSVYNIINEGGFCYNINNDFKTFLKDNNNIKVNKLSNLMIYLEKLYFKLAIEEKQKYNEKIDEKTRNKMDEYNKNKSGQLIRKDALSLTIIRFLLNVLMNQNKPDDSEENLGIDLSNNLLDYLSNQYLWDDDIYSNEKFLKEIEEYKNLNIYVKNAYDFYNCISSKDFENEINDILSDINSEQKDNSRKEIQKKIEEAEKKIKESDAKNDEIKDVDIDIDEIDITDYD